MILVQGDAEFILRDEFYNKTNSSSRETDQVHLISVGGISFKRYLDLTKLLNIKTAVIRDNDKIITKTVWTTILIMFMKQLRPFQMKIMIFHPSSLSKQYQ
ncbi:MAG: putative ATP-dependent endonuclease of OLD family [Ulvibacter sp.]